MKDPNGMCFLIAPEEKVMTKELGYFLKRKGFILPLILALVLCFGYSATHIAQGVDDLCRTAHTAGGSFIGTGRIFGWTTMMLLGHDGQETILQVLVGTALLGLGAALFCVLFRRASGDRIPLGAYVVFACLLVSFPMNAEAYIYADTGFMNKLSYALVPLAMLLADDWVTKGGWLRLLGAVFCIAYGVGMFESAAVVFVCSAGADLTLRQLLGPISGNGIEPKERWKDFFKRGFMLVGILVAAILFSKMLSKAAMALFSIPEWIQPSQSVYWFSEEMSVGERLGYLIRKIIIKYWISGLFNLSLLMICLGWCISLILAVITLIRRRYLAVFSLFVTALSPILLTLIAGQFAPFRTMLGAAPFVGFAVLLGLSLLWKDGKGDKRIYHFGISIMLIIALFQCYDMNNLFKADYENYQQELAMLENIHGRLTAEHAIDEKPLIFWSVGWYGDYSEQTLRYRQVDTSNRFYKALYNRIRFLPGCIDIHVLPNANLYWAIAGGDFFAEHTPQQEIQRYLHLLGYTDLIMPDRDTMALFKAAGLPESSPYPAKDCIVDCGEYIFINLG